MPIMKPGLPNETKMYSLATQNPPFFAQRANPSLSFVDVIVQLGRKHRCDKEAESNTTGREELHICCGSRCCQADRPYVLLPLGTSHISAPLIWQEWHLRRGCELCFNEHCTLLNSLCLASPCHSSPATCSCVVFQRLPCMHMSEHAYVRFLTSR